MRGRPKGISHIARSLVEKSSVRHGAVIMYRDTHAGRIMDVVPFCQNETGGKFYSSQYSVNVDTPTEGHDSAIAYAKVTDTGRMFVRDDMGILVEYIGSEEGYKRLKKGW